MEKHSQEEAEPGRNSDVEKVRREKIRGGEVRREKMQVREKVGKSRNTVFFQCFVAPEGRTVGSLKRGAEPNRQMKDEKLHAVVARSTFGSQKVTKTDGIGALLEVEMLKKCTPLWREAHVQIKMYKAPGVGPLVDYSMAIGC